MIHGPKEKYNDITPWKHTKLLEVLGGKEGEWRSWQVKTRLELEKLFADEEFSAAKVIQVRNFVNLKLGDGS